MRYVKARLQEKRQSAARAKQYYDDYVIRMRTRQMKRRTKEEQVPNIWSMSVDCLFTDLCYSDFQETV